MYRSVKIPRQQINYARNGEMFSWQPISTYSWLDPVVHIKDSQVREPLRIIVSALSILISQRFAFIVGRRYSPSIPSVRGINTRQSTDLIMTLMWGAVPS